MMCVLLVLLIFNPLEHNQNLEKFSYFIRLYQPAKYARLSYIQVVASKASPKSITFEPMW